MKETKTTAGLIICGLKLKSRTPLFSGIASCAVIKSELSQRFEIGEFELEAATHMDTKVDSQGSFEYMLTDYLTEAKNNIFVKGIVDVAGGLMSMFKRD